MPGSYHITLQAKWLTRFDCVCAWFQTADIDEKSIRRENPDDLVMVLAEAKVATNFPPFSSLFLERNAFSLRVRQC